MHTFYDFLLVDSDYVVASYMDVDVQLMQKLIYPMKRQFNFRFSGEIFYFIRFGGGCDWHLDYNMKMQVDS